MSQAPARKTLHACGEDTAHRLIQAAQAAGHYVGEIDLDQAGDAAALHRILARTLDFPDWYGHNLDALADCLSDFSWHEADGYLLVFRRAELLQTQAPACFKDLLDILEDSVYFWRQQGVAFRVVLIGDFPQLPRLQVDA